MINKLSQCSVFLMFMCFGVSANGGLPKFSIAFSPTTIGAGGVSTLTYTIDNSAQITGATELTFSNTLPADMIVFSPANDISNCTGGSYTATSGSNSISFSGARLGVGATCTFSIDVTSSTNGTHTNTTSDLTSSSGNSGPASADLVVATSDDLRVGLSFSPTTIAPNQITTLTYTLDGTGLADNIMAIYMTDTLSGLTVSNTPNIGGTCNAQITSGPGSSSIDISNSGTLTAGDSCTITVDVTGDAVDTYSNDIEIFYYDQPHPSYPQIPVKNYKFTTIPASVTIVLPMMYATFTGFSSPGTSASLTYTISNFQRSDITNLSFTNDLDATLSGLAATLLPANDFCGAGSTLTGSSTLAISGVNLSSGDSCSFAVTVLIPSDAAADTYTNTSSIINFDLDGSATTETAISNTLVIQKAPVLSALFMDDPVSAGDDVTLRYVITNTDSVNDATAISFTQTINDTYSGMVIKTLPGTNSCGVGSSVTKYYDGYNYRRVLVDNASLTAGGSCTFDVILTAPSGGTPGSFAFTTSGFTATVNGDLVYGAPASDDLLVIAAPALSLAIVEDSVVPGGTVSAEFTLNYSNNSTADATAVSFSVDLDSALSGLATTSAQQNDICGSGSSLSGTSTLSLSGASFSPGDSCTFSVILQLPNNTAPSTIVVTSSPVSATTKGQSVSSAAASDSFIISGLSMTQQFISNPTLPGASIISRYTISNHANAPAATSMAFTHNYSAVVSSLTATSLPAPGCGASSALSGSTNLSFSDGELQPGASCTFDVPLLIPAGAAQGSYNSSTSDISATVNGNNTVSDAATSILMIEQLSVLLTTSEASPTSVTPFSVSIFFSRDVVNFSASDLVVTNGAASNLQGSGQSYTADITPTADGSVTIDLPANSVDDAVQGSIQNPAASQLSLSYIATATVVTPSINISAPSTTSTTSGPVSYTVTYSDVDQVNLTSAAITQNSVGTAATLTVTGGDTTTPTVTFSAITGDGTLGFSISAGSARNSTELALAAGPSSTFLVDNTAPTLTITDAVANSINSAFEAIFTFSEDVTGFDVTDIVPTNAVLSNFNANSALLYTVTVTPSNDGSVTLNIPAGSVVDRVSLDNIAASQYQIEYDTTRPTVAIEGVTGPIASAFTATIRFSEDVSNFVIGDIVAPSATLSNFTAVTASVYTVLVSPTAQGAVTLNIGINSAIDAASNSNVAAPEYSVDYDSIPPSLTVFVPAQNAVDVSLQTQLTLTFSEGVFATASNNLIEIKNIVGDLVIHSIPANSSAVIITGNIATITLPSDLPERLDLYVTVAANAFEDTSGNLFAGFSDNVTWRFTSLNLPPVISGSPATQVDEDANYSFTPTVTDVDATDTATFSVTNQPSWASFDTATGALTGTPDNDDVGITSDIVITVTDIANVADSLTAFSITVTNTNDAPIITLDSTLSTDEDNNQTLSFTYTDVDGDTVSATVSIQASNGTVSVSGSIISYVPAANFFGADSFTLTLTDNAGYTTTQVISVTVSSVNDEPSITIDSTLSTDEDNNQTLSFTYTDIDGDTVSASVTTPANNGTASVTGTLVSYAPNANFNGVDSFTLTLTDNAGYTTTQVISVTVSSVNDDPTITIDSALSTDEDNNQTLSFTYTDVDGDTVSASVTTQPSNGAASVTGTTVSYAPNANYFGADSFTLTLTDNAGYTTTQVISVTVSSVNDDPTITLDSTLSTDEDNNQTISFTYTDVDGDTVSASVTTPASNGTASVTGTTINYAPNANFNGVDSFTLTLTDNAGYTTTQVISVTVSSVNDAPTITLDSTLSTDEDNNQTLSFTYTDVDGDTVSASVTTPASNGTASVTGTTVSYAPNANFNGDDSFTLTLTDNAGYTTTQVISVTVSSVNDAPNITIDSTLNTDEDNNQTLSFTYTDVDGDTVSASVTTPASNGTASVTGTTVSYAPNANFFGADSFTLTLTDNAGYTTTQVISVTVSSVNDDPSITINSTLSTDEDNEQTLSFTYTDVDGDTVSASVTTPASNGVASVTGTTVSYAPNANFNGADSFTLTLTDNAGYTTTQVISVTVSSVNDDPSITIDSTLSTDEDNKQTLSFTYTDIDGDSVSASVTTPASNGAVSVTGTLVSYTPNANFFGADSFTLTLTDNAGYTTTQVINVTVSSVNDAPNITIDSTLSTDEDNNQTLSFTYTDVDGDTVSASVTTPASNGTASVTGTTVSYAPNANFFGADSFTLTLTDNAGYSTSQVISVTVSSVNDAPNITIDSTLSTDEDNEQTLSFTYTDIDGDTVSASVTTSANNGTASVTGTTVSYAPNANFNGDDSFTLTLTDNAGYTTTHVISVTVSSVNDAPNITIDDTLSTDEDNNQTLSFTYTDVDGDTVMASVTTQASNGAASVTGTTVSYVPNANYFGADSFTLTLTDNAGYTTTQAINVTVSSVNDEPSITIDSTLSTNEDNNQTISFTYADIDGDTVSASVTTPASNGIVSVTGTTVSYAPNANFNGADSFTLTLTDNAGFTTTQVISVTVSSVNDDPLITIDSTLSTNEDNNQTLSFTYTDVDGDTVSASVTIPASNGTASVTGTTVSYAPNVNFFGTDSFTLTLTDDAGYTITQIINVTVSSVNDDPSISIDSELITNEDNNQTISFTYTDVDGDTVSASVTTPASHGAASVTGTTVSYAPNVNFNGTDSFTLTLTDNAGYTTTQVISVTVSSVNDVPNITIDSSLSTDEDNNQTLSFTYTDVDGDTVSASVTTPASHGAASVTGTTVSYAPNVNFNGTDSFTLTLTDNAGFTTTQIISVTVNSVNDDPNITIDSALITDEDNNQTLSFTYTDVDGDTVSASVTIPASNGTASVTGTNVSYAPNANFNGVDSFTLTLTDSAGYTTTQVINVTVSSVNDDPSITLDNMLSTDEDNEQTLSFTYADVDGDTVSASVTTPASNGIVSVTGTTVSYAPNANFFGVDSFTLTLTDNAGFTTTQVISVTVSSMNDDPLITIDSTLSTNEDDNQTLSFTYTDVDGDTVSASVTIPASNGTASVTGTTVSYAPNVNFFGTDSFTLTLTDNAGYTTTQVISVTVSSVNDVPNITIDSSLSTDEDNNQTLSFTYTDVDGDTVSASVTTPASHGAASVTSTTVSYAPNANFFGVDSFTLTLTDNAGFTTTQVISVTVSSVNDDPLITIDSTLSTNEDNNQTLSFTYTDVDGDTVSASVTIPASNGTASVTGTTVSYAPNANFFGADNFTLTLTDNAGYTITQVINVTVSSVNDDPSISIDSALITDEDNNQTLSFTYTDVDGDTVSASVTTQASNGTASVTGTTVSYAPNANFNGVDSFTLTLTDSAGYTTTQVINVTVSSVNDDPSITLDNMLSTDEDNEQTLSFTYADVDGDTVSAIVTTPANNGTASVTGTTVSYAPNANFNGADSFILTLTDNAGFTTTQVINVTVRSVNDAAEAVKDTFEVDFDDSNIYTLDVLSNDSDIDGDELYITGANTSSGSVTTDGVTLTLTMPEGFFGEIELSYTIKDGNASFAGTKAEVLIKGELSGNAPVIMVPGTVEVNANGLYTRVDLGVATALNSQGKPLPVSLVGQSIFRAGNHTVHWQATDADGLTTVASQQVIVHPIISLGKNQFAVEGKKTSVDVLLNGESPSYPLIVTLSVSGTAGESDYDIDVQQVTILSGTKASLIIDIVQDNMIEGDETLIIKLDEGNIGHNPRHVITIVETNIAPDISLSSSQNTEARDLVTPGGGLVTIQASVFDINDDNVNIQWLYDGMLKINEIDEHTILLDPSELSPGVYPISLMATDNADLPLSMTQTLYLKVLDSLAVLTDIDSDGDMIPDNEEGYKDSDQDGIPDFLDAISECNIMPEQVSAQNGFLIEGELGGCLRKGISLAGGETSGVQLTANDLEGSVGMDDQFVSVGGVFDFIVSGLPQAGQNYRIVLPQNQPIPLGSVYRKYSEIFGWGNFIEDVNNQLHSAPGEAGYCPAPADVLWSMGLTEGYWCVQLTIEDGGPNDNDGIANRTIVDPGGVAVALTDNTMPVAQADTVRVKRNESLVIDVLANDIDADDNILSIGVATATFGEVNLTADNQVNYQSKADFIGLDTLVYTLSDGNGGSDSGTVSITVYANEAPLALSDSDNTNDRTPIIITVLSNDSDADGDRLTIVSATVDEGSVTINQGTTLTYTPDSNFSGIATISYTIDDGQGEQSTAQVTVDVEAYQQVTVNNKAKGGSMSLMIIILTGALLFRLGCRSLSQKRLIQLVLSSTAAASISLAAAEPQWFIIGSIGQSQVKGTFSTPVGSEVTSQIWDDRDTSYSVGGGLRFVDISIMLSYEKLGEVTASYTGDVLEAKSFHRELAEAGPKLAEGISLQGQYRVWQSETLSASLGFGVIAWEMAQTSKINDSVISNDESDMNAFYTAALTYPLKDNMQISVKVTRYNLSINDINNIALALLYEF